MRRIVLCANNYRAASVFGVARRSKSTPPATPASEPVVDAPVVIDEESSALDGVRIVSIKNGPVNTLTPAVLRQLSDVLRTHAALGEEAAAAHNRRLPVSAPRPADAPTRGIILTSAVPGVFAAGLDLRLCSARPATVMPLCSTGMHSKTCGACCMRTQSRLWRSSTDTRLEPQRSSRWRATIGSWQHTLHHHSNQPKRTHTAAGTPRTRHGSSTLGLLPRGLGSPLRHGRWQTCALWLARGTPKR